MPGGKRSKLPLFLGIAALAALVALGLLAVLLVRADGDAERVITDAQNDELATFGETITGSIADEDATADYSFEGKEDEEVTISVQANDQEELDTIVTLVGPDDRELEENDDIEPADDLDSEIVTDLPVDGTYEVVVSAYEGSGDYELVIEVEVEEAGS